ncbi:glycosyltransferase family 2 protein [Nakamurella flava]|uniref:Glycosyltransferase family 2 protein n=1 Tax=Nakamurella flava TaxID=2576308 RepID=A0A4U6QNR3_9ACTN|nr:glycosyltransferase [Nakamurella flava]TKV61716.1 glycosyltransferase family 2 protein [Nakamurella flava]
MSILLLTIVVLGVSTLFWTVVGLGRSLAGLRHRERPGLHTRDRHTHRSGRGPRRDGDGVPRPREVAILIAAHNEAVVIGETISRATALVPAANIHVVSDGSSDGTADVVRATGANVLELNPNRGKAGALAAGIEHFALARRFEIVLLLDADTHLASDYLRTGLPLFAEPDVVAVAGRASTIDNPAPRTRVGRFLIAYRERLYLVVQLLLKYGQAARWANAVTIVPGFASMYRTRVLGQIDVVGAGLVIEDFNMTFELHAKRLGRIEFHPSAAVAYTQDPDNLGDYVKQVQRWILGFWQTVRRHGLQRGVFGVNLVVFVLELLSSCVLLVLLLPAFAITCAGLLVTTIDPDPSAVWVTLSGILPPWALLVGLLIPDLALTVFAVLVRRSSRFLVYALAFPLMRILDAALCLRSLARAFGRRSSGVWVSPTRRPAVAALAPSTRPSDVGRPPGSGQPLPSTAVH